MSNLPMQNQALRFLSEEGVLRALKNTGYTIVKAEMRNLRFVRWGEAGAVYAYEYKHEGLTETGTVYVTLDSKGQLRADY